MTFFQVLITNEFSSSLDRQYTAVYNYPTLAKAMETIRMYEIQGVGDGITTERYGRELCQQHLSYTENEGAVIELRHEYLNEVENGTKQFSTMRAIYVKEIIL